MTPEGRVKKKVKEFLKGWNVWTDWPVPSGYGGSLLDCIGCVHGWMFAIETKAPGEKLTTRQKLIAARMTEHAIPVFVIDTVDTEATCYQALKEFLEIAKAERTQ